MGTGDGGRRGSWGSVALAGSEWSPEASLEDPEATQHFEQSQIKMTFPSSPLFRYALSRTQI